MKREYNKHVIVYTILINTNFIRNFLLFLSWDLACMGAFEF